MKTITVTYTWDDKNNEAVYTDADGCRWDLSETFLVTYPDRAADIFIYHDGDEASALKEAFSDAGCDAEEAIKKVYGDKEVRAFEVYDEDDNYISTNYRF